MKRSNLHGQYEVAESGELVHYDAAYIWEDASVHWSATIHLVGRQYVVAATEHTGDVNADEAEALVIAAIESAIASMTRTPS